MTCSRQDRLRIHWYVTATVVTNWFRVPVHAYLAGLTIGTALTVLIFEAIA